MSDLFIPPVGAMQFEKTTPNKRLPENQSFYWVLPPIPADERYRKDTGCECLTMMPVLIEGLSPRNQKAAKRLWMPMAVCCHHGRVIE